MTEKRISVVDAVDKIKNSKGKIMTVSFIKRGDNSLRVMNCRTGVSKGVKGVRRNTRKSGLLTVYEMSKREFRHINISGLRSLKLNGEQYKVV